MSEASFASLGPTLLARKGGAKPAMRPQLAPLPEVVAEDQLEDLGWNDMGQDDAAGTASTGADIVSITPAAKRRAANEDESEDSGESEDAGPLVSRQHRQAGSPVLAGAAMEATGEERLIESKPASGSTGEQSQAKERRAAFTLRLDTDRHLKLRLAATMNGTSAQALVTEALDAMLSEIDDLDALVSRMKRS